MTVYTVYISFILFVLLLLLINSYFLVSLQIEKYRDKKILEKKLEIKEAFKNMFEKKTSKEEKETEIENLRELFNRKIDIEAFYLAVKEYEKKTTFKEELKELLERVVDIDKIYKSGVVRKEYKRSYALYLISEFKIGNKEAGEFALAALSANSVYVRNNALKVINKNHDIDIIMKALDIINSEKRYFNDKMLIDFLDNYHEDQDELADQLHLKTDNYNTNLNKIIIAHFTNMHDSSKATRDKTLDLLANSDEKEIIVSALRYFFEVIDKRAKPYILQMMDNEDWTIRATSARVIYKYGDNGAKDKIRESLGDPNYYVRSSSATSFLKLETKEKVIEESLNNKDRFARDILLYSMNIEGILSLDEYEVLADKLKRVKTMEGAVSI